MGLTRSEIRDPAEAITVHMTRAQLWDVYDLLVAKAMTLEADGEHVGSPQSRYRQAADRLLAELDRSR